MTLSWPRIPSTTLSFLLELVAISPFLHQDSFAEYYYFCNHGTKGNEDSYGLVNKSDNCCDEHYEFLLTEDTSGYISEHALQDEKIFFYTPDYARMLEFPEIVSLEYNVCNPVTKEQYVLPQQEFYYGQVLRVVLAYNKCEDCNFVTSYQVGCPVTMFCNPFTYFKIYSLATRTWEFLDVNCVEFSNCELKDDEFYVNGVYWETSEVVLLAFDMKDIRAGFGMDLNHSFNVELLLLKLMGVVRGRCPVLWDCLDNRAQLTSPFRLDIVFECFDPLIEESQWMLIYVGSANDEVYDNLLEDVLVELVNLGAHCFLLQVDTHYGGIVPKKPPLISEDHERAYFDYGDWALGKQGVEKPKGSLEALRPKLQPTQQQARYCKSPCVPSDEETEWMLIYVGSADDEGYDELLEDVLVEPDNLGTYNFVLQANALDPSTIPEKDKLGVTVVQLSCSYVCSYDDEILRRLPPLTALIERVQRPILSERPTVTVPQKQMKNNKKPAVRKLKKIKISMGKFLALLIPCLLF